MSVLLVDALFKAAPSFAFAQVVDLLEHHARRTERRPGQPPLVPLGTGTVPQAEAVRLTAGFDMCFHAAPIAHLRRADSASQAPELSVNFFGLGGPDGPLPEPFIEMLLEQLRAHDEGGADFLAMFQHRLLSYVYRAENEFRIAAPFRPPADSPMMPALRAILGRPDGNRDEVLDPILLANAGLVAQQRHSMSGLLALLHQHLGVAVRGCQFVGRWLDLPAQLQTVLGEGGQNDRLGDGAVLGSRAWDQNGAVEITLGPLDFARYLALLPGGAQHAALRAICAYYLGAHIVCHLILELDAVPDDQGILLGEPACLLAGKPGCLLAYTSWIGSPQQILGALLGEPECRLNGAAYLSTQAVALAERRVALVINDGEAYSAKDLP